MENVPQSRAQALQAYLLEAVRAEKRSNTVFLANFLGPLLVIGHPFFESYGKLFGLDRLLMDGNPFVLGAAWTLTLVSLGYVAMQYLSARSVLSESRMELFLSEARLNDLLSAQQRNT
jgi:hypothetical protein